MNHREDESSLIEQERENLVKKLRARMLAYLEKVGGPNFEKWKESCLSRIHGMNVKKPYEYRMYNLLFGGSRGAESPHFDFEGKDNIQKMIEELPVDE